MRDFTMAIVFAGMMILLFLLFINGQLPGIDEKVSNENTNTNVTVDVIIGENQRLWEKLNLTESLVNQKQERIELLENTSYYTQYKATESQLLEEIDNNPDYAFLLMLELGTVIPTTTLATIFIINRTQTKKIEELEETNRKKTKEIEKLKERK
jgi:hypothetical protein